MASINVGIRSSKEKSSSFQYCRAKANWDMDVDFKGEPLVSPNGGTYMPTDHTEGHEKYLSQL